MENEFATQLQLNDDVKVNNEGNPILGVLEGPCADFKAPTRNGRKYDESLWEKVFKDPIVTELIANGGIPGELDHPADRTETCSEKIAILMKEMPQKKNGQLWARFHILNTPCGKIAYTLAKAGFKLGISSRGSGETYTEKDGSEHVDGDSYEFNAFDLVLIPAVKSARLNLVTESLKRGKDVITLDEITKLALHESLDDATDSERKIMLETLKNLNIEINDDFIVDDNIQADVVTNATADVDGENVVNDVKRLLKENRDLTHQVKELQEKLSVCYAKDAKYDNSAETAAKQIDNLKESLNESKQTVEQLTRKVTLREELIAKLQEQRSSAADANKALNESVTTKDAKIAELTNTVNQLTEGMKHVKSEAAKSQAGLKESLQELQKDSAIKKTELTTKLERSTQLVEKYRSIAQTAIDKYISLQAKVLGVGAGDIKSRLPESYSFNDIDRVCESLKRYKLNVNSLPFDTSSKSIKVKVTESVSPAKVSHPVGDADDEVDEALASMARLG